MLTARVGPQRRSRDRGVVLYVALIVLVAMSLAAVVIARSVFTGNRVAGNLSFQQGATQSADIGIEAAVANLEANAALLNDNIAGVPFFYRATRQDPAPNQSWENFWQNSLLPFANDLGPNSGGQGYQIAYVIQRMCANIGAPTGGAQCAASPTATAGAGSSKGSGVVSLLSINQVYYRITVRVAGPRNTVGFVQAMVAI